MTSQSNPLKNVLVAEDSSVIQNLLRKILLFEDCKLLAAKDGQMVLDILQKDMVDLIIMDINLPKLDGISATKEIRNMPPPFNGIPIIGISGNAKNLSKEEILKSGMNDYMQKPLDYDKLIELVKKHISK